MHIVIKNVFWTSIFKRPLNMPQTPLHAISGNCEVRKELFPYISGQIIAYPETGLSLHHISQKLKFPAKLPEIWNARRENQNLAGQGSFLSEIFNVSLLSFARSVLSPIIILSSN